MPGSQYRSDDHVKCPYYTKESPTDLRCSGIIAQHTTHDFRNKREKQEYKSDFCNGLYTSCIIYQILDEEASFNG